MEHGLTAKQASYMSPLEKSISSYDTTLIQLIPPFLSFRIASIIQVVPFCIP